MEFSQAALFELGTDPSTDEKLLDFYVAVCGWGSGSKAIMVSRVAKSLQENGKLAAPANPKFLHILRTALEVAKVDGPEAEF